MKSCSRKNVIRCPGGEICYPLSRPFFVSLTPLVVRSSFHLIFFLSRRCCRDDQGEIVARKKPLVGVKTKVNDVPAECCLRKDNWRRKYDGCWLSAIYIQNYDSLCQHCPLGYKPRLTFSNQEFRWIPLLIPTRFHSRNPTLCKNNKQKKYNPTWPLQPCQSNSPADKIHTQLAPGTPS